jgi:hypothetical protein
VACSRILLAEGYLCAADRTIKINQHPSDFVRLYRELTNVATLRRDRAHGVRLPVRC